MTESKTPGAAELPLILEALLFVAEEPQALATLAEAAGVGETAARRALAKLADEYLSRGLRIMQDGQRYQIVTAAEYAPFVERLIGVAQGQRLTRAALEVLTIIAYKQPCARAEIEAVRGVNSDRLVTMLETRGLVDQVGQSDSPGRARLYRTTMKFLEHFGIQSPDELPPLPEQPRLETAEAL